MNKNEDLKNMYEQAASNSDISANTATKQLKKQVHYGVMLIVAVFAIILLAVAFRPKPEPPMIDTTPPIQVEVPPPYQDTIEGDLGSPVTLDNWQTVSYTDFLNDEESIEQAREWTRNQLGNTLSGYPSANGGYTSDVAKQYNEDGSFNLNYVYVLREDIEFGIATKIHRLINPVFGEWAQYQRKDSNATISFNTNIFAGMFSTKWMESYTYSADYSRIPIYADWESDNYGGLEFTNSRAPYFFGEVKELKLYENVMEDLTGTEFIVDAKIEFTANTTQGRVKRYGNLHLNLSPNKEIVGSVNDRLIVTEAWLQMDGEEIPAPIMAPVDEELESEKMINATN
jgi:hypothetical protein